MAGTNFAAMIPQQKTFWQRDTWEAARDQMFSKRFIGNGDGAMIQRIGGLTKTEKGERAIIQLLADLVEDGVIGDNKREGNEEAMMNYAQEITIDLLSHQVRNKGKMADQKTIINFRKAARSRLSYWLANRIDQLVFLTLSGISYAYRNDGGLRGPNSQLANLSFASDVAPLSANRHLMWDGSGLQAADTAQIDSSFVPNYEMIVQLMAYAKDHYIRPLNDGGKEYFVLLVKPGTLAKLKLDPAYQRAMVGAMPRSKENPWFTGATVTIDGAVIHEHRLVYSTTGAAPGSKWGAGGNTNGTRTLLCGAQALGMADIGPPEWDEEYFDYKTKQGISIDKMFGLLNPKFYSIYDRAVENFGVVGTDHYL